MHMTARQFGIAMAAIGLGLPAGAQSVPQTIPDSATVKAHKKLFTHRDAVLAGAFAVTTILLTPLDRQLSHELQDSSIQANHFLRNASHGVEVIASPGAYFIGGGLYAVGRLAHLPRVADLGWHGTEAVLMGEMTGYVLKGMVGRGRPFATNQDPDDFKPFHGFGSGDWRSFPSGHSTTAFAAAAAVTDETTLWWPKSTWIIGPLMYGGATMVALSRMYHNRHWASDVAVGALIGTFSGKKVVLASHSNPDNVIDRIMLDGMIRPSEYGGVKIGIVKEW
jgi:membrane-associated phospholipid phosphatase